MRRLTRTNRNDPLFTGPKCTQLIQTEKSMEYAMPIRGQICLQWRSRKERKLTEKITSGMLRQHAYDGTVSPWHKIIKSEKRVQEFQVDTTMDIQLSLAINTFFEEINILDRNDNYNLKLLAKEREDKINE
ncbi:hypothetical protein T12_11621 [Trichinella patagoniensis]|uniref:Uncharacterized protein n=1 Tax=Trichinella patagoniensis TaxID=990121 RepID=A0A0V1AE80_9BILA|nr:hypothetical protein T12_11621 [Trichinella patagoniensis]